jgi:Ca2+-dependent lipid-binding protein
LKNFLYKGIEKNKKKKRKNNSLTISCSATNLMAADKGITSDPYYKYLIVEEDSELINDYKKRKFGNKISNIIYKTLNPKWNDEVMYLIFLIKII